MNGKKITAVLTSAVCTLCILLVFVSAATETVYVPPEAALTPDIKYSQSGGGYVTAKGTSALTIPIPVTGESRVVIDLGTTPTVALNVYYLDSDFSLLSASNVSPGHTKFYLQSKDMADAVYIVFNITNPSQYDNYLTVDNEPYTLLVGDHTLAHRGYYEEIEIPDDTDSSIVDLALDFWSGAVEQNIPLITALHQSLLEPAAVVFGASASLLLIYIIFKMIGG